MKQIDAKPEDYRKQDPETGRWMQNVDRRLCRWGSLIGVAGTAMFAWAVFRDGQSDVLPLLFVGFVFGVSSGGLFILSLKRPDW